MSATIHQFPTPPQAPHFVCVVEECENEAVAAIHSTANRSGKNNLKIRPDHVQDRYRDKIYCADCVAIYVTWSLKPRFHPSVGLS